MEKILDVTHVSTRGTSLRITIPKKVKERLDLKDDDILIFVEEDGRIFLKKIQSIKYYQWHKNYLSMS